MIEYRGYRIKPNKAVPTCYEITTPGIGSSIPKVLYGLYTSVGICQKNIDDYIEIRDSTNDKKTSKRGV
jgi:hypothetical protein